MLRGREFLKSAGYNGDDARVLFARDAKPANLDALVAALDEGTAAVSSEGKLPADVALAHEIEAQCAHERHDASVPQLDAPPRRSAPRGWYSRELRPQKLRRAVKGPAREELSR